jgi:hypothetical protein
MIDGYGAIYVKENARDKEHKLIFLPQYPKFLAALQKQ